MPCFTNVFGRAVIKFGESRILMGRATATAYARLIPDWHLQMYFGGNRPKRAILTVI